MAQQDGQSTQDGDTSTQDYESFRDDLRDALNHLHDPDYTPTSRVTEVIGVVPEGGGVAVQQAILSAIEQLAPTEGTPDGALVCRRYKLLQYRFVQKLTQEQTAERLHLTVRSIRREQRVATHMLGRYLWEHRLTALRPLRSGVAGEDVGRSSMVSSRSWQAQARRELTALRVENPTAVAEVSSVISRVIGLEQALVAQHGGEIVVRAVPDGLIAAVHPAALRQVLVMAIGQLCRASECGGIELAAAILEGLVVITLSAPGCRTILPEHDLLASLLRLLGGRLDVRTEGRTVVAILSVPAAGTIKLLVVDDNADFVHFCRRCVRGTRYLVAEPKARSLSAIKKAAPDVVLLDIMLPDIDGWELLGALQQDPETAEVPVIVCSIVHEAELASLMGAVEHLPKPVHHRDLLATLERVTASVSAAP